MGRLIVVQYITLDGVVEDPDGGDGTPFGGWAMRYGPEGIAGDKFQLGAIMTQGVLLFGRRTWEHFSTLWPGRTSEFANAMNTAEKAVATSRPLDEGAWSNSHRIAGDLIAWLAETLPQRDVVVIGSGSLVSALQQRDLVDEYRLIAFPTALAAGRRLFPNAVQLDLVSSEQVGPGSLTVHTTRGPVG